MIWVELESFTNHNNNNNKGQGGLCAPLKFVLFLALLAWVEIKDGLKRRRAGPPEAH
jgi:hypothetical protein